MNTTYIWKWRVGIFDDNPDDVGVKATVALLKSLEVDVFVFGGELSKPARLDFLYAPKASAEVTSCQLLLVDMQWERPGLDSDPVRLPNLHDQSSALSDKLRSFVQKIAEPYTGIDPFPNAPIASRFRGFWVAAALSHLCPHSLICFFSGFEQVLNSPIAAAFRQFSHSGIRVIHKNATTGIERNDFFGLVAHQQQAVFKQSPEAFEWLVGRVFLPILIDNPPLEGMSGKLWEGDAANAEWTLKAEVFFPQWEDWGKKDGGRIKELSQFVTRPAFRLSQPKERSLKSIRHDLKTTLREDLLKLHDLDRPIQTCFDVGSAAEGVLLLIKQAQNDKSRSKLEQALKLCDSILENGLRQLDDLCLEYSGAFTCMDHLERKPDPSLQHERDYSLPFDLAHFRRAVEALTDNAITPNGDRAAIRLNSGWDGKHLSIEYVDKSLGFEKFDNPIDSTAIDRSTARSNQAVEGEQRIFADSIIKSIRERGLNRGLPLALTFPFFYPVHKLECLISGRWIELFPNARREGGACSEWRFGVRWIFDMPHLDNR
jgi:hypothetical protein